MNLTAENHSIPLKDGTRIPLLGLGTYGDPRTVSLLINEYFFVCQTLYLNHNSGIYICTNKQTNAFIVFLFFSKTPRGTALECVKLAIDVGYRHFDGALVYFNEHEVGQAIREKIADGTVRREDIFYCGKVKHNVFYSNSFFLVIWL